jgi:hypothetical protein
MAAEGRAPLVDFCIRYDPRAQLRNRPNPAHHARGRPRPQLSSFHAPRFVFSVGPFGPRSSRTVCQVSGLAAEDLASVVRGTERGWPCFEAQPTEISRARGLRRLSPTRGFPPPRSLAVEASPQPDRPGHLMSRARGDAGRSCLHRRSARTEHPCYALASEPRLRRTRPRAASCDLPRRRPRSAAPEVPSIAGPPRERLVSFSTNCPQPVDWRSAFSISTQSRSVTRARRARTRVW